MKSLIESDDQTDFSAYLERRRQERQQRQDDDLEKKSRGAAAGATASEPMHLEAIFGRLEFCTHAVFWLSAYKMRT